MWAMLIIIVSGTATAGSSQSVMPFDTEERCMAVAEATARNIKEFNNRIDFLISCNEVK